MRHEQNTLGVLGAGAAPAAVIGLVMTVLTAGDVISGAVVAWYQRIGLLTSLGLSPAHVVAADLSRVSWPALAGCFTGVLAGGLLCVVVLRRPAGETASATSRASGRR
jgi:hypothetical protein